MKPEGEKFKLEERTKNFAVSVINFIKNQPKNAINHVILHQLLKSATSIGANYREANRAESRDDFIHKIGIVQKEASETQYWLELMLEINLYEEIAVQTLLNESTQLLTIFTSIGKNLKTSKY